jgi:hypothetical protein
MSSDYPGTSLSEKEIQDGTVLSVQDKLLWEISPGTQESLLANIWLASKMG